MNLELKGPEPVSSVEAIPISEIRAQVTAIAEESIRRGKKRRI